MAVDLRRRFLCADGACIGIIGPDATCKECGKPIASGERAKFDKVMGETSSAAKAQKSPAASAPHPAEHSDTDDGDASDEAHWAEEESSEDGSDDEWAYHGSEGGWFGDDASSEASNGELANRRLCSDGACIGVIGPDDKCKECGKPYDPSAE